MGAINESIPRNGRRRGIERGMMLLFSILIVIAASNAMARIVATQFGDIEGEVVDAVSIFKGIPYAAPPVGLLRWRLPQPPTPWKGVKPAKEFGYSCMQARWPGPNVDLNRVSEDCLTLNIYSPMHEVGELLPVMVVIHGGGFFVGGSSMADWNGATISKRGIVVVTFNYRLGVFGFFAHPMLSAEDESGTSGAYGLLDQIAALEWVQRNVSAFGGDPRKVTIMGESAGGSSVLYLMASPLAKGLFRAAISQSPGRVWFPMQHLRAPMYGLKSAEDQGVALGPDIAALRALPANELLARAQTRTDIFTGETGVEYWPIVDGHVLPEEPAQRFDAGQATRVSMLIGTNADEGFLFTLDCPIKTVAAWHEFSARRYPAAAHIIQAQYPAETDNEVRSAVSRWINDWGFAGTARAATRAMSAQARPVYLYEFTRVNPRLIPLPGIGSFHSMELAYMFGNLTAEPGGADPYNATDRSLSDAMIAAWVRFVTTGDPNGPGIPMWPRYEQASGLHMEFGDRIYVRDDRNAAALDAFDEALGMTRAASRRADRHD